MRTEIELEFGDGKYLFKLPLVQINELQSKTGLGIGALYAKLLQGRYIYAPDNDATMGMPTQANYAAADVIEPIRLGLIGGGQGIVDGVPVKVTPLVANRLVENYVYPARPFMEAWTLATSVLSVVVEGCIEVAEAGKGKKKASTGGRGRTQATA